MESECIWAFVNQSLIHDAHGVHGVHDVHDVGVLNQ